jgi:multimeric flavodoxin WrbA
MTKPILIIGINGSPRKTGETAKLLRMVLQSVEAHGGKTQLIHLIEKNIKPCLGCYSADPKLCTFPCKQKDDMGELHQLLLEADGVVFGTPTYWFAPSGLMKNFIDRLTCLEVNGFLLEGKVAGFIASAEESGGDEAMMALAETMNQMGLITPPYSTIFHSSKYKSDWALKDGDLLGKNMVQMCRIFKEKKPNWDYEDGD